MKSCSLCGGELKYEENKYGLQRCVLCSDMKSKYHYFCSICGLICPNCYVNEIGVCSLCFKIGHKEDSCSDDFSWKSQKVLWIGWKQDDCVLSQLPKEIIHEIIYRSKKQPFDDFLEILRKYKDARKNKNGKITGKYYYICWKQVYQYQIFRNILKRNQIFATARSNEFALDGCEKITAEDIEMLKSYNLKLRKFNKSHTVWYDLI